MWHDLAFMAADLWRLAKVRNDRWQRLRAMFAKWSTDDLSEFSRLLGKLNADL